MSTDRFNTVLSVASLAMSIVTLALTSPLLIDLFVKPNLTAAEVGRELDGDTFRATFLIGNHGWTSAHQVELVLNVHPRDTARPVQNFTGTLEEEPNGPSFKTVRLRLAYLAPDEQQLIIVTGARDALVTDSEGYNMKDGSPANIVVPAIVSLRSDRGLGVIKKEPPWLQVNVTK